MPARYPSLSVGLLCALTWTLHTAKADQETVLSQLRTATSRFDNAEKWAERRAELRREFLLGAGLGPLPARPPAKAIRHSLREHDGYTVENIAIETLPGFYCTGNLYRPIGRKELQPAILCPHGHFRPLGRYRENHQIRCAHLARMGATVFSYSMVGWQDSQQTTHDDPRVLALQTWNSLRVVDFLSHLERVDPERIGITGASGGGTQTFFLSLIDDRIKASAPLVIVYPWTAPDGCLCEGGLPVMQQAQTNAIELAAASAPRPQLLISVGNDPTEKFPTVGFPFIQHMYGVAEAADAVSNLHLANEKHDFGPSKRSAVYEFFAKHLQLTPGPFYAGGLEQPMVPPEDLSRIVIETPEQMSVFNSEHPLPAAALQGSDAIGVALERYVDDLRERQAAASNVVRVGECRLAEYSFRNAGPADETLMFTAPGFDHAGAARTAPATEAGQLTITVRDGNTGRPTPCRINVVGPDGNYYEPSKGVLKPFSLTGVWPQSGWGNRQGKAPIRYFGRFFYSRGESVVNVPSGTVRVEVWKGFEYQPLQYTAYVGTGAKQQVDLTLEHTIPAADLGYSSGDPHIHIHRRDESDEARILDLMQAEDIRFGTILAYNEPAGPYDGFMRRMEAPQLSGVGQASVTSRGDYSIISGQEYRSRWYGHINFFLIDQLVFNGSSHNANDWPPFGMVARRVREEGGISFYAHGGYAQEIYADVVQDNVDGVELLQFGVYRGIGLLDWYHMLNAGFRVPANGACDYPACRKLGDCKTYVATDDDPTMQEWLRGMTEGRSFVTSGPVLLLDVEGEGPGGQIDRDGEGPHRVTANVRVRSDVAPVTHLQLIANGRIVREMTVPRSAGQGCWLDLTQTIELDRSAWVSARAFSLSATGTPDAESHTNPVYVIVNNQAPYEQESLDVLVAAIDGQIAVHKKREFEERAQVIAYFEKSRDILMAMRDAGGVVAREHPSKILAESVLSDPTMLQHSEEELQDYLRPVPPRSAEQALQSFETIDGIEMQLVAQEPDVVDPVAAAFDESGNLYVCEMRDYPYKPADGAEPIGTVRLLRDTDGNGTLDRSTVFADRLLWAGGVAPWKGGVFVAAAPDIWYLRDTDGDDKADYREKIFTGFGTGNQQAMLNNLTWGLDHKIYGSTAHNGGLILTTGGPAKGADPVSVTGHDFRFDPETGVFEAITGTVQFGNTFDDWGNRFLCSESRPLLHAVLPQHYLARNPFLPVPSAIQNLTGGPVPIHRISPLERWRIIRSSRRVGAGGRSPDAAGASHHVIDAAAGVTIYRGGCLPADYSGNVFIGGAQNNLIHRRTLQPDGLTFTSKRADQGTEFVRSADNWFRPVNFVNAPDGTLYVLDMYREILESIHVPDDVVKYLDLTSGREHGRIYRIAPNGFESAAAIDLSQATTEQLVQALESPVGWQRTQAHRLLHEQQDASAVSPLRNLLAESSVPQARLHALWSLSGLQAVTTSDVLTALDDSHQAVQEHAIRLAEPLLNQSPQLLARVIEFAESEHPRLRTQAAFSLGESADPAAARALAELAVGSAGDAWLRTAALSSAGRQPLNLLKQILQESSDKAILEQLTAIIGASGDDEELEELLLLLKSLPEEVQVRRLLLATGTALRERGQWLTWETMSAETAALVKEHVASAADLALNDSAEDSSRIQAVRLLSCLPLESVREQLRELLSAEEPAAIQVAAVTALAHYQEAEVAGWLLEDWQQQAPAVRSAVLTALLSRPQWALTFLQAAVAEEVGVAQVDSMRRSMLREHGNDEIRTLARQLFSETTTAGRAEVLTSYRSAADGDGDQGAGLLIFRRECSGCHRIGADGFAVGPDLASSPSRDAVALMTHILDPNRYVLPNFESYVVVDTSGRMFTGIISSQTATSITLKRADNQSDTILRSNIDELAGSGRSLMPAGFEKKINVDEMRDLIAFLQSSKQPGDTKTLGIGTLPGLTEPSPQSPSPK